MATQAQKPAHKADTAYYDAKAQPLPSRQGAARGIVTEPLPGGGVVQKIFSGAGTLLEQIPYADAQANVREGLALSWFPGGELKTRKLYKGGLADGQMLVYYPSGVLHQVLVFRAGQQKSAACFGPDGQPGDCPKDEPLPNKEYARYRHGEALLGAEINRNLRYPALASGAEPVRGQVVVACMIGVDGKLRESRIFKGIGPAFDQEAMRVVGLLRGAWIPQLVDGEPEESFYTIEVNFYPPARL